MAGMSTGYRSVAAAEHDHLAYWTAMMAVYKKSNLKCSKAARCVKSSTALLQADLMRRYLGLRVGIGEKVNISDGPGRQC